MQLIIRIEQASNSPAGNVKILANNGMQIHSGQVLFRITDTTTVRSVIVHVPWQPLIVKNIEDATVSFRNPWSKINTVSHGNYF